MAESRVPLPSFDSPPVIETILGVQFPTLQAFGVPHFGLYWSRIRSEYPNQETQPPLNPEVEQFGERPPLPTLGIQLVSVPEIRCWFINSSKTELIQVQRDRFVRNWRKRTDEDVYPTYDALKPRFRDDWATFCAFLEDAGIDSPEVNQCEVTYINNFELSRELQGYGSAHRVVSLLRGTSAGSVLPEAEMVQLSTAYVLPDKRGRLHVSLQPAIRRRDAKPLLQFTLVARGRPASSRVDDLLEWFDMGHEWIVRSFADLTTEEMHRLWKRR